MVPWWVWSVVCLFGWGVGSFFAYRMGRQRERERVTFLGSMQVEAHRVPVPSVGVSVAAGYAGVGDAPPLLFTADLRAEAPAAERYRLIATDVYPHQTDGGEKAARVVGPFHGALVVGPCQVTDSSGITVAGHVVEILANYSPGCVIVQAPCKLSFGCRIRG